MADPLTVLGAVASTIQLIDLSAKVFDRLNNYIRHIDEVPETLREIKLHLPLFIETLQRVQTFIEFGYFNPRTSAVLKDFVDESYSQMVLLDDLLLKITPDKGDSMMKKGRKAIISLKEESTLKKIFENISGYIEKLLLFQSSVTSGHAMIHTQSLLKMHQNYTAYSSLVAASPIPTETLVVGHTSEPVVKLNSDSRLKSIANYSKRGKDRQLSYFLSLSRFGLLWALQVDLNISWGNKGVSILPGLHFQQLVKNTSPGLEVFTKYMFKEIDTESASHALIGLVRRGVVSPYDVFPDGATWLEKILTTRFIYSFDDGKAISMLRVLCQCGARMGTQVPMLLVIAKWRFVGYHLRILRELIAIGYDCSTDSSLNSSAYANLYLGNESGDMFLLHFLAECSKNAYGVCGQTALMDAILCGSLGEIERLVQDPRSLRGTNLLGQSPVHVAVLRPNALSIIVRVFGDLDMPDLGGKTPLEYAVAYGSTESMLILLESGANPVRGQDIPFLQMAYNMGQWELLSQAVVFFRNQRTFPETFLEHQLKTLMVKAMDTHKWRTGGLHIFLRLGVDTRTVSGNGDTLLHFADSAANVAALFPTASEYIDDTNNDGWTALMRSIGHHPLEVSKAIVQRGCNINHQDTMGRSALHIATEFIAKSMALVFYETDQKCPWTISSMFAVVAILISEDADPFSRDKCRCACSDGGCSPTTLTLDRTPPIHRSHDYKPSGYLWVLEWLLTLSELRGQAIAGKALLDLIRFKEFQKAELTHVCASDHMLPKCRVYLDKDEIDEILDEEKEIIWQLEEKMEEWKQKIDYLPVEEAWLDMLNEFCPVNYKPPMRNPWWHSSAGGFHEQTREHDLPSFMISSSDSTSSSFYIDEVSDVYWVRYESHADPPITPPRLYIAWVEHFYKNRALYDYPIEINHEWYEKRKYWANRQFEVLRDTGVFEISQ